MVAGYEGRGQGLRELLIWGGFLWMVVVFSLRGGVTGMGFVFSGDRALERGKGEFRWYLREYSLKLNGD